MNLYNCLNKKVFITNKTRLFKCEIEFKTNLYNNVHTLFFPKNGGYMKNTLKLITGAILVSSLSSCSLSYKVDSLDECVVGYSKNNAFIECVTYNLDTSEIHLPSEYKEVRVEELDWYYGRGVPTPFFLEYDDNTNGFVTDFDEIEESDTIIEVNINIYLPKYLKKCAYIQQCVSGTRENNHNTIYIARCNYYIDNESEYFYTKNDKLFNRNDNTIVDKLIYQSSDKK